MRYSIIVPIYNRETYLLRCLDSVVRQTYTDWEIILVDDGSSDSSPMICDEFMKEHPEKVQVIHQENCGVLCARRAGIGHAKGEYLCFLDSDDYWDSNLLEETNSFQNTYDPDVLIFGFRKVGVKGEVLEEGRPTDVIRLFGSNEMHIVHEMISECRIASLCTQVVKRSVVDFDIDYSSFYWVFKGEDLLQNLAFLDKASTVLLVPNIYYSYFTNVEGLSHRKISLAYLNSHVVVQEKILEYAEKWGLPATKTYQVFVSALNSALKALMQNSFLHPVYSTKEVDEILSFLSSDLRYEYVHLITIDWNQKRIGLCLWLLKRQKMRTLKFVLFFCRILNVIKLLLMKKRH